MYPAFIRVPLPANFLVKLFQKTEPMSLPKGYLSEMCLPNCPGQLNCNNVTNISQGLGFESKPGNIFAWLEKLKQLHNC